MDTRKILLLVLSSSLLFSCGKKDAPTTSQNGDSTVTPTTDVSIETPTTNGDTTIQTPTTGGNTVTSQTPTTGSNPTISIDNSNDYDGYYKSISGSMTGGINGTLRAALTDLIDNPKTYSYSGTGNNQLGGLLAKTDVDTDGKMVLFYSQDKINPEVAGKWNREHVWPQSLSGGLYGTSGPGADMHHIRPTATITNSNRGNLKYGNVDHSTARVSKNTTYGTNTVSGWYDSTYFEPLDSVKGDAARIILYMYTCYYASGKLNISNVAKDVKTLVEWSNSDLPSAQEKLRNQKVFEYQGNRNPYIDHPEYVNMIFGDGSSTIPTTPSTGGNTTTSQTPTTGGNTTTTPSTSTGSTVATNPSNDENNQNEVILDMAALGAANNWTSGEAHTTLPTGNDSLTVSSNGKAVGTNDLNTGKYYTVSNQTYCEWRIYQNESAKITFEATDKTIESITFVFTVKNTGTLLFGETVVKSGTAVAVNASKAEFTVGNSGSATNGQVRIQSMKVVLK